MNPITKFWRYVTDETQYSDRYRVVQLAGVDVYAVQRWMKPYKGDWQWVNIKEPCGYDSVCRLEFDARVKAEAWIEKTCARLAEQRARAEDKWVPVISPDPEGCLQPSQGQPD